MNAASGLVHSFRRLFVVGLAGALGAGCMSAAKVCPAEVASGRLTQLECEMLVARRNEAVTNKWVGIIGVAAALDNSGSSRH